MNIQTVGIIGYGNFGSFAHHVIQMYFAHVEVRISSTRHNPDDQTFFSFEDACMSDLLILAVPISAFDEVVERAVPVMGTNTILVDICTVKSCTVEILKRHGSKIKYLSTHPMFGFNSYRWAAGDLGKLRLIFCDHNLSKSDYEEVKSFLSGIGLRISEQAPDEHDKMIADTLFLAHLVSQILTEGKFERSDIGTASFDSLMNVMESLHQDRALFQDVYKYNPYCKKTLEQFFDAEQNIRQLLTGTAKKGKN
ncbi:prephenate dehydrogenase [Patescibacteria group bacterium]|nr:prephenate dehydrogenase [Patescibacteria group bacterium]